MTRNQSLLLIAAIVVGFGVRLPGVFWGYNFPAGWQSHHPDEATHWMLSEPLIDPSFGQRWEHPYPRGTAAHVAVPFLLIRTLQGQLTGNPPPSRIAITATGRFVSVLYGTATILVLFLFCRRLFRDPRVAVLSAWILALGGLHVTQSHFFLADVPALFWFMLGSYLLYTHLTDPPSPVPSRLLWGAFSYGVAFGVKLVVIGLPSLGVIVLMRRPRIRNAIFATVFFLAGFVAVNLLSYSPTDLYETLLGGTTDPWEWSYWANIWLYLIELPSLVSLPILLLALGGIIALARRLFASDATDRRTAILLVVLLPMVLHAGFVAFKLDHFLRHLIPFIPWLAVAAAWSLTRIGDALSRRRIPAAAAYLPVFAYLVAFVFDGERVFIQDPRNEAAAWILENVPQGSSLSWRRPGSFPGYETPQTSGRPPDVVVMEMHNANHYLSGMGLKNSYPRDYRRIFDAISQESVDYVQALFKGESEYREVARFDEGYLMPEYVLVNRLIGNRSRNYVAELVIFRRDSTRTTATLPQAGS